ncbi:MAG TPA: dienelactone hydrolase family protein [Edaphobacter sp.]|nr:dienelactone hydrolase family protein [Edaphobacter sp.]
MILTRRELLEGMGALTVASGFRSFPDANATVNSVTKKHEGPPQLPGTDAFRMEGDIAAQMVAGIHRYLQQQTDASVTTRQRLWHRDFSSSKAYEASVAANRERFAKAIGVIDRRLQSPVPSLEVRLGDDAVVALGEGYKVYGVRWPVLDGVDGEGLLLEPNGAPVAQIVALPDADWSPEMAIGLAPGVATEAQFARRLAESGCRVLVPVLINRDDTWSGNDRLGIHTNLTHREFIYRMAYEMGRHVIGYEVQKILAAVDWFANDSRAPHIGVMGYGEGGLLAMYSAAVDTRIHATCVSGYFTSRQNLWQEPLYRNVWTLLQEFGDAEIAGLIAPRALIVEASRGPEVMGPPPVTAGRSNSAASGTITSPDPAEVRAEVERARPVFAKLNVAGRLSLVATDADKGGEAGCDEALSMFLRELGATGKLARAGHVPIERRAGFDASVRLHRQFDQLVDFTQRAVIEASTVRDSYWSKADRSSVESWERSSEPYRKFLWEEIFGKLDEPFADLPVQSRKIYDEANWAGYEVFLPLWGEVFAYGILLLPYAISPGERRPVVVCQHGLEERPEDLIHGDSEGEHYNHNFAADLADHGFVVYCPQNPYIGGDKFRKLQRLANPLKYSLYSFILSQSERMLDWLGAQPFVDPTRIGFYGLSYGGKTAMRVPPLLNRYALSICSGDFNEWIWKVTRTDVPFSYCFTPEYEVPEFNLGNTFNHSDMANLMTPRPFMVERGHNDPVSVDSWVAYEYAKVQRHYELLGLYDRTRIEYFNGPHGIHGVGTFDFLHKSLNWGEPYRY